MKEKYLNFHEQYFLKNFRYFQKFQFLVSRTTEEYNKLGIQNKIKEAIKMLVIRFNKQKANTVSI